MDRHAPRSERNALAVAPRTAGMRRRAVLGSAGALAAGLSGCLTTLGVTERGLVRSKFVRVRTGTGLERIAIDAISADRLVDDRHREEFPQGGPLVVPEPLHERLTGQYETADYGVRHDCNPSVRGDAGGCGEVTLSRGDFNSLRLGDTAELLYRGDGATVVRVSRPSSTPDGTPTGEAESDDGGSDR